MSRYYSVHSRIYDLTRWSFLFGRAGLPEAIGAGRSPRMILEVGCGTGANLERLGRAFPDARLMGIDASGDMLKVANRRLAVLGRRVELRGGYYDRPLRLDPAPDLILFAYSLSMMGSAFEGVIRAALEDLAPGGQLVALDFHRSDLGWFRRWMGVNHVRMEGHLLPALRAAFPEGSSQVRRAYLGIWKYFLFVGTAPARFPIPRGNALPLFSGRV